MEKNSLKSVFVFSIIAVSVVLLGLLTFVNARQLPPIWKMACIIC